MIDLLEDIKNLRILYSLVSGESVSVNYSMLSDIIGSHRVTLQKRVEKLYNHHLLEPPCFPFQGLFKVYPLLTVLNIDIPECVECSVAMTQWIKEDPHIVMAYRSRQGDYDSLLFTLHENLEANHIWMSHIPEILENEYSVEKEHATFHSNAAYCSNNLMRKFDLCTGVRLLEADFEANNGLVVNGLELDELDLEIIKQLACGSGIKYNHSELSRVSGLHLKTVSKRVEQMLETDLLRSPVCRFPNWYVPPGYLLSYSFVKSSNEDSRGLQMILEDPYVPLVLQTMYRKYNLLIFSNHRTLDDQLRWETHYHNIFPEIQTTYLSQEMEIGFNQREVSLRYIESKMKQLS